MGISEMRRTGEGIDERSNFIMYHKGEVAGHRGVGFLVKLNLKSQITGFEGISDRIAAIHIHLPNHSKNWTVIQVYSPTEQATRTDIDNFYNNLTEITEKYSENNLVIMGDFNAQVGARAPGEEQIIGKYGSGKRSENGKKLVTFLLENNLTILNSVFRKKPKSKWTWLSPDGKTRNEIDYILTNKVKEFSDTGIIQNLNFNTNHRMVRSCLCESGTKKPRPKAIQMNKTQISNEIWNPITAPEDLMTVATSDIDLKEKYNKIENKLKEQTRTDITKSQQTYLSEETIKLIEDRKNLITKKDKKENQKEISNLSKQIREKIRKDRIIKRNKTLENYISKTGGTKKALKELREQGKEWITKLKDKNRPTISRNKIQNIATDYYRSIYKEQNPNQTKTQLPAKQQNIYNINKIEDIPEILESEVEKSIKSQKMEKAPGPDKITNELIRGFQVNGQNRT
ncbi:hypothetical protein B5X24_HaOG207859 [Helicoverpa armigera]|uniref:Endonuclease/exonuclease/phosphatase domain-containing protein n=1 Tax=Helicoverpa armigera TaxID=29058 RepID=A0A2W1BNL4_HELAM|nr:hypothetical protein B5X24_HaOG207859 [Helicoverpa armigera]